MLLWNVFNPESWGPTCLPPIGPREFFPCKPYRTDVVSNALRQKEYGLEFPNSFCLILKITDFARKIIQCNCLALLFISTQNWIGQSYSPPEWKHHAQYDFNVEEMVIEKPIEQSFKQLSHEVFEAHNVAKNQLK